MEHSSSHRDNYETVESLQSHCIDTVSLVQWSTRLLPVMRDPGSMPWGYLCETGILLLVLSCYKTFHIYTIGDSDVIDHCGLVWGGLCPEPSLGRWADNVIIPLDLTQLLCPSFLLAAGPPSGFTTDIVGCWGGALWRACNLTELTQFHWSSGPPVCFLSWGTRVQSPGEYLCETGILLLALSCYKTFHIYQEKRWNIFSSHRKEHGMTECSSSRRSQEETFIPW